MDRKFEGELDGLRQELLSVGARVEKNIGDAMQALISQNVELAGDVLKRDPAIDYAEIQIDEHCLSLLALRQPVARDLRFITTALKIVKDMERVGDIASDICQHTVELTQAAPVETPETIQRMGRSTQRMLKKALDAFVNRDADLAREVLDEDDQVDDLYRETVHELIGAMIARQDNIDQLSHLLGVAKHLERIGDHSCNIAEMVVFLVEGKDIRHWEKIKDLSPESRQF